MSAVIRFAEESCWDRNNQFRQTRKAVSFRMISVGRLGGVRINRVFSADYGIYYDPDDSWTREVLSSVVPEVDWADGRYVFWKKSDHSGIEVIDTDDDSVVATISVNRGVPRGEEDPVDMTNVVDLASWRLEREG